MTPAKPEISVIIPNLHSQMIDQTLHSVLDQETNHSMEIIVVGMDKWHLVEKFPEVNFIETPEPVSAPKARNIGIKAAHSDWLVFIDSDCIAQSGWLNTLLNAFEEGWPVIGGGVKTPETPYWRLVYNLSMFHKQLSSQKRSETAFLPTLNLAVKREVVDKVGLMDEELPRGQDVDWTARMNLAGYRMLFEPSAVVEHLPARYDLQTLRKYFYKSGYYMIRVRHRYPQIFKMPGLLRSPLVWRVFAPFISAGTTAKIFLRTAEVRQHFKTLRHIYLLKMAWCRGAADSLEAMNDETEDLIQYACGHPHFQSCE